MDNADSTTIHMGTSRSVAVDSVSCRGYSNDDACQVSTLDGSAPAAPYIQEQQQTEPAPVMTGEDLAHVLEPIIQKLSDDNLSKIYARFALLTCVGFIPAAISYLQFIDESYVLKDGLYHLLIGIMALSTAYLVVYIAIYTLVPLMWERRDYLSRQATATKRRGTQQAELPRKYKLMVRAVTHYRRVDICIQLLIGILCIAVVVICCIATRTDDFGAAGCGQLFFTIWIFVINIPLALLTSFKGKLHILSDELKRRHFE
ncbi:hypothetical protein BCR43DRAFT_514321 [Syncephalastrum racemosum]|uniref:Uncharacterized protein n=1 Tax=Syncephalastrum racemosum TaxID=13706 RepID=A0A1X2HG81_SYNRA|nr:hypothetical protein BCR43DRAFT_514321 [Syncephalastrum racemosum]